ncbi:VWA domain-containing protein [bacterium]|nr:VWA domain-containing protein [bacterium]
MKPSLRFPPSVVWFAVATCAVMIFAAPVETAAQPNLTFKRIRLDWPIVEVYLSVGCDNIKNYFLQSMDLEIFEDGRKLDDFGIWCPDPTDRCPISVALVFDASGSMVGEGNAGAKAGGRNFIANMDGVVDEACVVYFNNHVVSKIYPTTRKDSLEDAVDKLPAVGSTQLWDGVYRGLVHLMNRSNQCRAVIVLTDGDDNFSSHNLQEVIAFAVERNIRVFPIGYGDFIRRDELSYLAQITGGNYYEAPDADGLKEIYKNISTVLFEFFQECVVSYEPRCADGFEHEVVLNIPQLCNGSDSKHRNYFAPLDSSTFRNKYLTVGQTTAAGGTEAWVPIEMLSEMYNENLYPLSLDLRYDKNWLQLDRVETPPGTLLEGMRIDIADLQQGGKLRIPTVRAITGRGTLCYAVFTTATTSTDISLPIEVEQAVHEKGCLIPLVDDGSVTLTESAPGVTCAVTAPSRLQWDTESGSYLPSPFEVRVRLENRGTKEAQGGTVRIEFDPNIYDLLEPRDLEQSVGDIEVNDAGEVAWMVHVKAQSSDTTGQLCFPTTFANHANVMCCKQQDIIAAAAVLSCSYELPELSFDASTRKFVPNPFDLSLNVENIGDVQSGTLGAELKLPAGLYLKPGETLHKTLSPDVIPPSGSASVTWQVQATSLTGGDHFNIQSTLTNDGVLMRNCSETLVLPFIPEDFTTTVDVQGSPVCCSGDSVVLEAEAGFPQYRWSTGESTRRIVVRTSGSYSVAVLDAQGRVGHSQTVDVTILPVPQKPAIFRENNTLSTTASPPLQWYRNGIPIPGANTSVYVMQDTGTYTVETWVVESCRSRSDAFVAYALGAADLPVAESMLVDVFPDPSLGQFTVRVRGQFEGVVSFQVLNLLGQELRSHSVYHRVGSVRQVVFDMTDVPRGMYLVSCQSAQGLVLKKVLLH